MKLGLHNHSNYSDGIYSIERILRLSDNFGLDVVAITDHNEIRGSLGAFKLRNSYKVDVLLGVELFFWYQRAITELLVYFLKPSELKGFYKEFIGTKFIPTVESPKELEKLVTKYNGLVLMPHPKASKGCIKNDFKYPTQNIETINHISRNYNFNKGHRDFGGADLHIYKKSLGVYSELVDGAYKEDLFNESLEVRAIDKVNKISFFEKMTQRLIVGPLDIKYMFLQIIRRKIFKKAL